MSMYFKELKTVRFPTGKREIHVNMMPVIHMDWMTVPDELNAYIPMMHSCDFPEKSTCYLSVFEGMVEAGNCSRRLGIHTDGTCSTDWGGGGWGKGQPDGGIYMASSDGACFVFDEYRYDTDEHGALLNPVRSTPQYMMPWTMYWFTDRTPHQSLPATTRRHRMWFRYVSPYVDIWWAKHSTHNPQGVKPNCKILSHSKFI